MASSTSQNSPFLGKSVNKPIFGTSGCQYPASSANPSTAQDPPPWWWPESQGGATISPIWKMPSSSAACSSPSRSSTTTCSPTDHGARPPSGGLEDPLPPQG